MESKVVFDLSNSKIYDHEFSPMCEILISRKDGYVSMGPKPLPVGAFSNLRRDGEKVLADITLIGDAAMFSDIMEYSIQGLVLSRDENGKITSIEIKGIGADIPPRD